jgi:flagellar hook-length control protein FliK
MSEVAASMLGSNLPTETTAGMSQSPGKAKLPQNPDGTTFPQLFASFDVAPTTLNEPLADAIMNPFAPLPVAHTPQVPLQGNLQNSSYSTQTGNSLPQNLPLVSISGFVARGNQNGAAAISFAGDEQQLFTSTPQQATTLVPAVEQSQLKLKEGLLQQFQNSQLALQEQLSGNLNKQELSKQMELLAELTRQSDSASDNPLTRSTTPSAFSQLFSTSIGPQELASSGLNTTRGLEPMTANLQQPNWNAQLGDRINMMISKGMNQAEIRLNPPELGLLEVKIQVQGDQTNVNFSTPHGQVRDALDAALPRLREMLEENGLTLGEVDISHQSLAQGQSQTNDNGEEQPSSLSDGHEVGTGEASQAENPEDVIITKGNGLLDVFA